MKICYQANKNNMGSRRLPYKSPILANVYTEQFCHDLPDLSFLEERLD